MYCPKCGIQLRDENRFCTRCGAKLSEYFNLDDLMVGKGEAEDVTTMVNNDNACANHKIDPKESAFVSVTVDSVKPTGIGRGKAKALISRKTYVILGIISVMVVVVVFSIMSTAGKVSVGYYSDEQCAWCGSTPTKEIASQTTNCEAQYYCERCATTCFACGEKATTHATNLLGLELFLCSNHAN